MASNEKAAAQSGGNAVQRSFNRLQDLLGPEGFRRDHGAPLSCLISNSHMAIVKSILRMRRRRDELFGSSFFADPAWDMLLELYLADLQQYRISVSWVCTVSDIPATTGLRHLNALEAKGLVHRIEDRYDRRRNFVELTTASRKLMSELIELYGGDINHD